MTAKKRQTRRGWGRIRKLPSGRIQAGYIGPDLKTHHAPHTFSTRTDAEAWLAHERNLIDWGKWSAPSTREERRSLSDMTVAQWLTTYFDTRRTGPTALKLTTLHSHLKVVRNRITDPTGPGAYDRGVTALAQMPIAEVTTQHIYVWWDSINRVYPDTLPTNTSAYKRLHTAFKAAADRQIIPQNPVKIAGASRTPAPKPKYLMQDWEVNALIKAAPDHYRLLTCLIFAHGLRIGEALGLEQRHLKLVKTRGKVVGATVVVEQTASRLTIDNKNVMVIGEPKTAASYREVPILDIYLPVVVAHMASHAPRDSSRVETYRGPKDVMLLTCNSVGGILMDTCYRSYLARMKKKARVSPEIHPHCGRYWFITRLAEGGATPKEIGQISGQEDSATITGIYTQVRQARPPQLIRGLSESLSSNLKESTGPDSDHGSDERK